MTERHLTTGVVRWARGVTVGLLTVLLGTAAHVVAGGHAPPIAVAAPLAAVVTLLAVGLSGRRWESSSLLGLFLLAQTGIHVASMSVAPHGSMADPAMIASHVLAAAVLVATVLHGERVLHSLVDHLALRGPRLRDAAVPLVRRTEAVRPVADLVTSRLPVDLRGRAPPVPAPS